MFYKDTLLIFLGLVKSILKIKIRTIGFLPFFHIYALFAIVTIASTKGCEIICLSRFDLTKFLTIVQENKIKRLQVVPPVVLALAKHHIVEKFDLSSLKVILCAAAPLSTELSQACQKRLNVIVKQGYGMTESSPL